MTFMHTHTKRKRCRDFTFNTDIFISYYNAHTLNNFDENRKKEQMVPKFGYTGMSNTSNILH